MSETNADFKARIAERMKPPTAPPAQPGTEARRLYELETARPYLVIALEILKRAGSRQSADKVESAIKSCDTLSGLLLVRCQAQEARAL